MCTPGTDLHLLHSSRFIKDATLRRYLEKLYADDTFDPETSDNVREHKTSIIINEIVGAIFHVVW